MEALNGEEHFTYRDFYGRVLARECPLFNNKFWKPANCVKIGGEYG